MFGLDFVVFRPHNVYGEHQNIGDRYRNVIGIFMNQIMKGEPMTIFGDGEQTRAFTHVADVAPVVAARHRRSRRTQPGVQRRRRGALFRERPRQATAVRHGRPDRRVRHLEARQGSRARLLRPRSSVRRRSSRSRAPVTSRRRPRPHGRLGPAVGPRASTRFDEHRSDEEPAPIAGARSTRAQARSTQTPQQRSAVEQAPAPAHLETTREACTTWRARQATLHPPQRIPLRARETHPRPRAANQTSSSGHVSRCSGR